MALNSTLEPLTANQLIAAYHEGSLGISLSIAGFLVAYMAGAVYMLAELGIIDANTKIAGASSGALLTMARCSGLSSDQFSDVLAQLSRECRARNNCQGKLGAVLQQALRRAVPPGAHRRCRGRGYFSLSLGRLDPPPKNLLIDTFTSDEDFISAALASSWIPIWSGPAASTTFRGQKAFDGFFSDSQPCPPGVKYCLKISSRNPPWGADAPALYGAIGRATSAGGFKPQRLANSPPGGFARVQAEAATAPVPGTQALARAAAIGVDIAPGIYSPQGLPQQDWDNLLVMPGDPETNRHLYEAGARDARAWARLTGLEAAAAARRAGQGGARVPAERGAQP